MRSRKFVRRLRPFFIRYSLWLEYGGLALLILLPLLTPGYILTFDMSWGPHTTLGPITQNTWALHAVLWVLGHILPGWVVQKLLLFLLFLLAGVGAHILAAGKLPAPFRSSAYLAGILYVLTPFLYTRFVAGQWLVMAGYALLPWAVRSLWDLMSAPSRRSALRAGMWAAAVGLTSIHTAGMLGVIALVFFVMQGTIHLKQRTLWSLTAVAGAIAVNGFWLVPALMGHSRLGEQISSFSHSQLHAFATHGTVFHNPLISALTLEGFWADPQHRYIVPSHAGVIWGFAIVLCGLLIGAGVYAGWKSRDKFGISLTVLGIVSLTLGLGIATSWTAPITEFLIRHVPFYQGYREPHKWLMVLALTYACCAAFGLAHLRELLARRAKPASQPLFFAALLLPVIIGGVTLFGAHGQLRAAQYPAGWTQAKTVLDKNPDAQVLVLPWHMYLPVSFAGRVVANPAGDYFSNPVITGNDPELRGVAAELRTDGSAAIDAGFIVGPKHLPHVLQQNHIRYVLLLKEADWHNDSWLDAQPGLHRILDNMNVRLYQVEQ